MSGGYSLSSGSGTVTSVGLTMPNIFAVADSPVTTSGVLAVTLATQTANTIFAGPTSGGAATPTFRTLVAADIPSLSTVYLPLAGGTMAGNIIFSSGDIGTSTGATSPVNITGSTLVQFANSSTNYARLTNLAANSPMLVLKSGSSNPIQLYAYTDGLLYLAFNGGDRFTFASSGNFTATTGGIASATFLTSGSFGLAMQTVAGADAGSSVISANIGTFFLNPAGTIASYTITMPASPYNGMIVYLTSSQIVTSLTHAANSGHTITAPLTAFTVGGFGAWQYHSATTNWNRIG